MSTAFKIFWHIAWLVFFGEWLGVEFFQWMPSNQTIAANAFMALALVSSLNARSYEP